MKSAYIFNGPMIGKKVSFEILPEYIEFADGEWIHHYELWVTGEYHHLKSVQNTGDVSHAKRLP